MNNQNKPYIITLIEKMKEEGIFEEFLGLGGIASGYDRLIQIFSSTTTADYQELRKQCLDFVQDFSKLFNPRFYPDFSQMYEGFLSLEEVLYQFDARYRDHLFHSLSLFILMSYILYPFVKSGQFFKKRPFLAVHTTTLHSLFTVAIMHDIGYPIEKYTTIYQELSELFGKYPQLMISTSELQLKDQIRLMVADYIKEIIRSEESTSQNAYGLSADDRKVLYLHAWEQRHHGIVAALYVLYLNRWHNLLESDRAIPVYSDIYKSHHMAASAIAVHDEHLIFKTPLRKTGIAKPLCILFESFPLTFLLRLLDEIQDWHRPSYMFPTFQPEGPHFDLDHINLQIDNGMAFLEIRVISTSEKAAIETKIEQMKTNLEPLYSSVLGVKIQLFQREGASSHLIDTISIGLTRVDHILDHIISKTKEKEISGLYFYAEAIEKYPCVIDRDINQMLLRKGCQQTEREGQRYYITPK